MTQQINLLKLALLNSWTKDTAYPSTQPNWSCDNRHLGQCAITSLVVQDFLGGEIICGDIVVDDNNIIRHFWNNIDNRKYDLTIEQFSSINEVLNIKELSRDLLLGNADTYKRYIELSGKVINFLNKFNDFDKIVHKCQLCGLEKSNAKNIYFGTNTELLLVGEAPAANGWRITGRAWINTHGKVIPSGKVLQKLLANTNVDLFDISFVEIIKCFPSNRKQLSEYANNCMHLFDRQLELISPSIIITLGEIPTRAILGSLHFKKLSDVAGKEFKYKNKIVIPIYHPSPVSPLSYNGNKPIFDNIISKYV